MGDRATIQMIRTTRGMEISPCLYTHGHGSIAESFIRDTEAQMGVRDDLHYAFARLAQNACMLDPESNIGFGVYQKPDLINKDTCFPDKGLIVDVSIPNCWSILNVQEIPPDEVSALLDYRMGKHKRDKKVIETLNWFLEWAEAMNRSVDFDTFTQPLSKGGFGYEDKDSQELYQVMKQYAPRHVLR